MDICAYYVIVNNLLEWGKATGPELGPMEKRPQKVAPLKRVLQEGNSQVESDLTKAHFGRNVFYIKWWTSSLVFCFSFLCPAFHN